jgi:hypothetical protein
MRLSAYLLLPVIGLGLASSAMASGSNKCVASEGWKGQILSALDITSEMNCTYGPLVEKANETSPSAAFIKSLVRQFQFQRDLKRAVLTPLFAKEAKLQNAVQADPIYKKVLEETPSLQFLYGEFSGVSEGYTIGEHSVRVLQVYENQKDLYGIKSIHLADRFGDLESVMKYTLAFHDIGKSIAQRSGDKSREADYSGPISDVFMKTAGFSPSAVKLARALIHSHQVIGLFLQQRMTLEKAVISAKNAAAYAEVDPANFFKLMEIIFVCDAGSYDNLRNWVFETTSSGLLQVKDQNTYNELKEQF